MAVHGSRVVGRFLCLSTRVIQRPIGGRLLAVVVPAVLLGAEDLIHADDKAVAVKALAAVDFERLFVRQAAYFILFQRSSRSGS